MSESHDSNQPTPQNVVADAEESVRKALTKEQQQLLDDADDLRRKAFNASEKYRRRITTVTKKSELLKSLCNTRKNVLQDLPSGNLSDEVKKGYATLQENLPKYAEAKKQLTEAIANQRETYVSLGLEPPSKYKRKNSGTKSVTKASPKKSQSHKTASGTKGTKATPSVNAQNAQKQHASDKKASEVPAVAKHKSGDTTSTDAQTHVHADTPKANANDKRGHTDTKASPDNSVDASPSNAMIHDAHPKTLATVPNEGTTLVKTEKGKKHASDSQTDTHKRQASEDKDENDAKPNDAQPQAKHAVSAPKRQKQQKPDDTAKAHDVDKAPSVKPNVKSTDTRHDAKVQPATDNADSHDKPAMKQTETKAADMQSQPPSGRQTTQADHLQTDEAHKNKVEKPVAVHADTKPDDTGDKDANAPAGNDETPHVDGKHVKKDKGNAHGSTPDASKPQEIEHDVAQEGVAEPQQEEQPLDNKKGNIHGDDAVAESVEKADTVADKQPIEKAEAVANEQQAEKAEAVSDEHQDVDEQPLPDIHDITGGADMEDDNDYAYHAVPDVTAHDINVIGKDELHDVPMYKKHERAQWGAAHNGMRVNTRDIAEDADKHGQEGPKRHDGFFARIARMFRKS